MSKLVNNLKKKSRSCKIATYLIEKKSIDRISLREMVELKKHLSDCSYCRIYQRQSAAIDYLANLLFHGPIQDERISNEQFKTDMQRQIEFNLNQSK